KEESFQIFSFFLEKLIDKKNEIRKLSQNALKRLLEESMEYNPDIQTSNEGLNEFQWLNHLPNISCWEQAKDILWTTFTKIIHIETNIQFISAFIEFLYSNYIRNALEISLVICSFLIQRK